jgi:hypothetical protein
MSWAEGAASADNAVAFYGGLVLRMARPSMLKFHCLRWELDDTPTTSTASATFL